MQEQTRSKLESARRELLDLGLRNPLLNYRLQQARGVQVTGEQSVALYDILVQQGKAMRFLPRAAAKETVAETVTETVAAQASPQQVAEMMTAAATIEPPVAETTYTDLNLQTAENEQSLQTRLLNTYYAARTSLEEQGVNILYLALGMLHWYEESPAGEKRKAPLILVPVTLERSSARERFRLRYSGGDVETNLSLQARLKADFNISLPALPEEDAIDVPAYFAAVAQSIEGMKGWELAAEEIVLSFFSFGKFLIYHDLDADEWPETAKPEAHNILQSLFGAGFSDTAPGVAEDSFIDHLPAAQQLYQVLDADSSQVLSMLAVQEGRSLVIQGPPGTGKSQTITNIIANAIGQGKKVLFVAEKQAALDVVKRRLDAIHLGDACLELHSNKANKKELHNELRRTMDLGKPAASQLQDELGYLEQCRAELNDYCIAMNTAVLQTAVTPQQAIGYLVQLKALPFENLPVLAVDGLQQWDAARFNRAVAFAEQVQARLQQMNAIPQQLLFWGSQLKVLLPAAQEAVAVTLAGALVAVDGLRLQAQDTAALMELDLPVNRKQGIDLADMLQLLSEQPDLQGIDVLHADWLLRETDINELLASGTRLYQLQQQYAGVLIPEAWDQDVLPLRQHLLAYGDKWYKFLNSSWRQANRTLAALCTTALPADTNTKLQYVNDILEAKRLKALVQEHAALAAQLYGNRWQKNVQWDVLQTITTYITGLHQQVQQGKYPAGLLRFLAKHHDAAWAQQQQLILLKALHQHGVVLDKLIEQLQLAEEMRFPDMVFLMHRSFEEQQNLLQQWQQRLPELHQVIQWNTLAETAAAEQLQSLLQCCVQWAGAKEQLKPALQKTWYEFILETAITAHPSLRRFERASHETMVQQFCRLDQLNLQYNRLQVALKHWEHMPGAEAGGQVNVLRTEFNKKARHKPLRKLVQEAGMAIQAIKPVFMMSPLSIANFLPPGSLTFDLVIFDEASQVRPVDALGAILRGKQLVVVGDNKQLPPTSFFDTLTRETDDEDNVTADMPSILGLCDAQGASQRMLRWHYRSRHQSLISLSNREFYENKLVIFPGAGSKDQLGLLFHHLAHTVYDRGNTRSNPLEAEAVADAVVAHARNSPTLTLGVVAFSTAQMQAIQHALETRRRKMPELEKYLQQHADEPFFVKNLENVQGDERDVIFISIGYGRTADGSLSMLFGPLNNDGGERRLNVLITRAKLRCEVFTNITADDIDATRSKAYGVRALKSFLHYAQHGRLQESEQSPFQKEMPFEKYLAATLREMGYTVHEQVGATGCRIDLAIADPEVPGRYLLGIECDGFSYHSTQSARDRERLRYQVLQGMGWHLYRVWSTDWFRNPQKEKDLLVQALEQARSQAQEQTETVIIKEDTPPATINREAADEQEEGAAPYQLATVPAEIAQQEFHQHPLPVLAGWLEEVVRVESPVHMEEAARRLVEAAGLARMGTRMKEHFQQAVQLSAQSKRIVTRDGFLWHIEMAVPVVRDRSALPAVSRRLAYIAPEEMSLAIQESVADAIAIQPEAAALVVARRLGFVRITDDVRKGIQDAVEQCIAGGVIVQDAAGWLKAVREHES
ncbi:DUF3320 domain-containing protein [Deminuibacter soli]|uniref:DUF3320 domain-containing protein n=1 Tax=Deminuibacter soli TaxID=2291815 RepID=A0A3E1NNJ7_9BACT|nr:DUF3320 domain-containing protein [Deminuibacter soli]RFM29493.1 DUF3320 domain-containing protein [Deminuibacter soli]